jgi:tetratricopeptide (TPR) repeat protein
MSLSALPLAMLVVAGCTQVAKLKSRLVVQSDKSSVSVPVRTAEPGKDYPSVAAISNQEIQRGHYAEAEKALRRYLGQHPGDRPAQAMLRQLTVDPEQMLGRERRVYVVQRGDSYSSLAARYLGDPSLFLILARYNGSTQPSLLRVGERLQLPLSALRMPGPVSGAVAESIASPGAVASDPTSRGHTGSAAAMSSAAAIIGESSATKAGRLQDESVSLLKQGQKDDALMRLDQALLVDPQLRSNGSAAALMRRQLVAQYHQRAIVLYRDQQLDQAITLWNRALTIDPKFEPAIIYRARALELKRRLRQF